MNRKTAKVKSKKVLFEWKVVLVFLTQLLQKLNIHGVKLICNSALHPFERGFWLTLLVLTFYGAYSITSLQYERYTASPTVMSLERDYREWNGTLPAITVCYHNRIDEERAQNLIKRLWSIEKTDDEFTYFLDYIKAVVAVNESFSKFTRFANDKRLEDVNMLTIAKEVHPMIHSAVSSFDTNIEYVMNEIITERGICYSVNSMLSPLISTM